jgi:uncharacterized membrane-anchored protein
MPRSRNLGWIIMQNLNVPSTGARYWFALCIASILGANLGDFVAKILHLGHYYGLAPLALLFCVVIWQERRASLKTEAYYWIAILILRTMATNLADLTKHELGLDPALVMPALLALLIAAIAADMISAKRLEADLASARAVGLPVTGNYYWATMLIAGTLGTVIGDYVADVIGLGAGWGTIALGAVVLLLLLPRLAIDLTHPLFYWLTVVAIRAAGTTAGDFSAQRHGLDLGLPISTAIFVVLLAVVLTVWPRRARLAAAVG